ncbi:unnamed protein product [Dracunculus medinensis]|uniref:Transposase n=1 Tax=Dracunculus medinensis TaxID=318479 RepID=A0A0N4UK47_DRAME|nr:unnamed protein product [Dracunculus medinensis]
MPEGKAKKVFSIGALDLMPYSPIASPQRGHRLYGRLSLSTQSKRNGSDMTIAMPFRLGASEAS